MPRLVSWIRSGWEMGRLPSCLTPKRRVASDAIDERAEDGTDSDTSSRKTDRGSTGAAHLGSRDKRGGRRLNDDAPRLHRIANYG